MVYAGLVKMAKSHCENCNNNAEETHVQGDYSTLWLPHPTPPHPNPYPHLTQPPTPKPHHPGDD